jgi:hypothetical protein
MWQIAVVILLAGVFLTSVRQQSTRSSQAAAMNSTHSSASAPALGDSGWGMVESFTEARRRQAELLRLAL